jgi:hypothetical protein
MPIYLIQFIINQLSLEKSMSHIHVVNGSYRGVEFKNVTFKLARPVASTEPGKIQIINDGQLATDKKRVFINVKSSGDYELVNNKKEFSMIKETKPEEIETVTEIDTETDDQAIERIASRFSILDTMTKAAINGDIRAMIVSGPSGVGKSYGVERQLEKSSLFDQIAGKKIRFEIVKGAMTPIGLYSTLFKYSDHKNVLVFDDCDSVLMEDLSLNVLKAALDSGKRRRIFWNSDSSLLRREGIPDHFDFNGSVIFITNMNFSNLRSKKLQDHLEALQSRCHYIDLTINTDRDKMLRIRGVHRDALRNDIEGLFTGYGFEPEKCEMIMEYMWTNRSRLREISLRMALKIADLVKISPNTWDSLAQSTCMK